MCFGLPLLASAAFSGLAERQQLAKIEAVRRASLTPEQRLLELREREVDALERLARARENTRRDIHHRFFS